MKHNKYNEYDSQTEQSNPGTLCDRNVSAKPEKRRPRFRPYIKNTVSVSCGLFKNDEDSGPITQHEISASFRIRLIPVLISFAIAMGIMRLTAKKKKR